MNIINRFLKEIKNSLIILMISIVFFILLSVVQVFFSSLLGQIINASMDGNIDLLAVKLLLLVLISIILIALNFVLPIIIGKFSSNIMYNLRKKTLNKLIDMESAKFIEFNIGDLTSRLNNDLEAARNLFNNIIPNFLASSILAIVAFIFGCFINLKMSIGIIIIPILINLFLLKITKPLHKLAKEVQESMGTIVGSIKNESDGIIEIKSYNLYEHFENIFKDNLNYFYNKTEKLSLNGVMIESTAEFGMLIQLIFVFVFGSYLVISGELNIGKVILFQQIAFYIQKSVQGLNFYVLRRMSGSLERIIEIWDKSTEVELHDVINENCNNEVALEFRNISYSYNNDNRIINNLSFKINKGECVAIIGKSGAGKTTILNLINKSILPDDGEIYIFGKNINQLNRLQISEYMSVMEQNTHLFAKSIYENLSIVCNIEDYQSICIEKVISKVEMSRKISELDDGIHTHVNELGKNLSGGEKQKLALARVLLRNKKINLFDEPTSNFDDGSEDRIMDNIINGKMDDETIILVSHNSITISKADRIIDITGYRCMDNE